jgi:hypothetical protein
LEGFFRSLMLTDILHQAEGVVKAADSSSFFLLNLYL